MIIIEFFYNALRSEQLYYTIISGIPSEVSTSWSHNDAIHNEHTSFVLDLCDGIVDTTKSPDSTVQFVHDSVVDFFLKENGCMEIWPNVGTQFEGQGHEKLKECCINYINYIRTDRPPDIDMSQPLPEASSKEAAALRNKMKSDYPFLEYAVQNVLYHADTAQSLGISQNGFIQNFPLSQWIYLNNLLEECQVNRRTPNASLLYILAEGNLSSLIQVYGYTLSDATEVGHENYGPLVFAALATGVKEAIQLVRRAQDVDEYFAQIHKVDNEYPSTQNECFILMKNFTFSKDRTILSYLAEHGNNKNARFFSSDGKFRAGCQRQ
ncbi:hypothetical protein F4818DRAFT_438712 [Hypoxylon cercidicola]|nr:hypothetical protein F4818DRAFT_438712 [Hypoxylon cercidicola]